MAGERILVIDDSPESIKFIVDYVLLQNGYIPLTARDGAEGLRRALAEHPDLILLDMQMPKMDGLQVLEALGECGQQIPVIMMTFHGSEELAVRAFRLGAKNYVMKPFEVSEILSAIDSALTEFRLRQERDKLLDRLLETNKQLEQRLKELNILYSIGKSVTALLDLDKLFGRLVDAAVYITGAEEGWLMLLDEDTNELYVCAAKGLDERHVQSLRLRTEDGIAGAVLKSGEPILIGGGRYKVKTAYLVKSLMAVPIKIEQRTIGVLSVDYRVADRTFGTGSLNLLSALADYAAIALENVRLFTGVKKAQTQLAAILNGTSDAILVVDERKRILLLNNTAAEILSVEADQAIDRPAADIILNQELQTLFDRAANSASDLYVEVPSKNKRTFNAHLTPLPGVGDVVVMQDITHLKELEELKSEFVSTVSHDLRSPLTSIRGFVDLIEMAGPLNDRQKDFVGKIRQGILVITELVNDLLDLGRIEQGVAFDLSLVPLQDVIFEAVDVLRGYAASKKQEIDLLLPSRLSPVMGNKLRLCQAVENLVGNAIKYTPKQGRIRISAEEKDGQIVVRVQDSGIGISAADQARLFTKFYRIQRPETENIPGTGLGLSITATIVTKHGGRIWVDSELNKGSTFTFLLPIYQPEPDV